MLAEALAVCPICQDAVAPHLFENHLRRSHGLHTYRGVRRPLEDTLDAIVDDLLTPQPADLTWQTLVRLTREEYPDSADEVLASRLGMALARLEETYRESVCRALAPLLAPGNEGLVAALADNFQPAGRLLALICLPLLSPGDRRIRRAFRHVVTDRALPPSGRLDALVAFLPQFDEQRALSTLHKLLSGSSRSQALEQLRQLEQRTGPLSALALVRDRLDNPAKMLCPRCGIEMPRVLVSSHLWEQHHLVYDGLRAREPWQLIEEWLDLARPRRDAELVERCRIAADKIDPKGGRERLTRLLLARGLADSDTRRTLLAQARDRTCGCCPWCYAFVPVPREEPLPPADLRASRLLAGGYHVSIDEQGLRPRLTIVTPTRTLFEDREPGRDWTAHGAAFVYSGIFVLLALLAAIFWPTHLLGPPIRPVAVLLVVSYFVHLAIRLAWRTKTPARERVLRHTWNWLVPRLHEGGFQADDSAFMAGLARLYSRAGRTDVVGEVLTRHVRLTEQALERGQVSASHLASLVRLQIEVAAAAREDPVLLVVRWVSRCFAGQLPIAFAQHLLEDWATDWWNAVSLARLRVLLCDRAFEAGFEVQSLLDAGQNAPALGTVLATEAPRSLAALRLLWSMRATRPWDRLGELSTAFDLATSPKRSVVLGEHPDLLLWQEDASLHVTVDGERGRVGPATILLTLAGVWLQEVIFSIPPRVVEVRARTFGWEMVLGSHTFRCSKDLDPLSRRMERWFRWVFHEFLAQVDRVLNWQSPDRGAILRAWGAVPCPECNRYLLSRIGEVGIALDESKPRT